LLQGIRQWVELGMPSAASFALQVYPQDVPVAAGKHQWIVKRIESQFLWSLSGTPVRERITERGTSNCRWSAE
jgi:hypothetical protein